MQSIDCVHSDIWADSAASCVFVLKQQQVTAATTDILPPPPTSTLEMPLGYLKPFSVSGVWREKDPGSPPKSIHVVLDMLE